MSDCYDQYYQECSLSASGGVCGSSNWSSPELVSQDAGSTALALDRQGNVHVAWQGDGGTGYGMKYRVKSRSGGWSATSLVFVGDHYYDFDPAPVVGASSLGNVYVVWTTFAYNSDLKLQYSYYDGNQWSGIGTVTTDIAGIAGEAAVSTDGSGTTHLVWTGSDWEIYYSESGGGGPPPPTSTPTVTPTPSGVDLAVQMTPSRNSVPVGQSVNYAINVVNNGPRAANDATLTFRSDNSLFADARFYAMTSTQGTCTRSDNSTVVCFLNALAPSDSATVNVVVTATVLLASTITNTADAESTAPPPELNPNDNEVALSTSTALPKGYVHINACWLTDYYDTAHFRIHYTRSFPNMEGWPELDCTLMAPDSLDPNGYPRAVAEMGDALEASYVQYGGMGFQVNAIYHDPSSGRYPVYVIGDPVWNCPDWVPSNPWCRGGGYTYRSMIMFTRGLTGAPDADPQYGDGNQAQVDWLRPAVAHEFFHATQNAYIPSNCFDNVVLLCSSNVPWWMEASAVWAETKVYPQCGWCQDPHVLLNQPYVSMTQTDGHEYASYVFARYMEDKVAASDAIILQTWQRFQANGGGNMLDAINQVLAQYGNKSLATEFPEFARNNYFLGPGTYGHDVNVYTGKPSIPGGSFQGLEWGLFRFYLGAPRDNIANGFSGAQSERVNAYPWTGPSANYGSSVGNLGAAYLEFLPTSVPSGHTIIYVTMDVAVPPLDASRTQQVRVMPLLNFANGFGTVQGSIIQPVPLGPNGSRYAFAVVNFEQCDRVTLIASGTAGSFSYSYHAETAPAPPPGTPIPACTLQ